MLYALRDLEPLSSTQEWEKNTGTPKNQGMRDSSCCEDPSKPIMAGSIYPDTMTRAERYEYLKNRPRRAVDGAVSQSREDKAST